jgi:hypothetical protein
LHVSQPVLDAWVVKDRLNLLTSTLEDPQRGEAFLALLKERP